MSYQREDKNQAIVETPFGGRGLVIRTRVPSGMKEIRLLEWEMVASSNSNVKPMLYTMQSYPSVAPLLGDHVMTPFGRGTVVDLRRRKEDQVVVMVAVTLTQWRLAQRSKVVCYLQPKDVNVVRAKTVAEMDTYERVEHAQRIKNQANTYFKNKQYDPALGKYAEAVEAVRYVQHDSNSNNYVRADLVTLMITCCNNAGTCCVQLSMWDEAIKFSRNALVLLDALYNKRGMKIHTILHQEGIPDAQLFGEWRVKSYILTGRAWAEKHQFQQALDALKLAHETIVEFTAADKMNDKSTRNLQTQAKEVKRLHAHCMTKRKLERKKEKQRAQAMFGVPSSNIEEQELPKKVIPAVAPAVAATTREPPPMDMPYSIPTTKKNVTFKDPLSDHDDNDDDTSPDEATVPWYHEHFEALVVLAGILGGVALTAFTLSKRSQR